MNLNRRSDNFLLGFILFSLLLHLLFFLLLPKQIMKPAPVESKPVYIDLRPPRPLSRELDLPPTPAPEKPRETPAKRLGAEDREVKKETAPKGKDFEDLAPKPRPTPPARPRPQTPAAKPVKPAPEPAPENVKPTPRGPTQAPEPWRRPGDTGPPTADQPAQPRQPAQPSTLTEKLPPVSAERLKNLDLMASAKTAAASVTDQWRRKYRTEVEEGDTVWLDTEKDILISFFQRFRRNVYMVWNYPDRARELGQEGTCLLRVTITRAGEVKGVILKESSGHTLLDETAIRAVQKGAPYGPLPQAFPKDELNIMVFFQYGLDRRPALL